jgi:hypothetical protein
MQSPTFLVSPGIVQVNSVENQYVGIWPLADDFLDIKGDSPCGTGPRVSCTHCPTPPLPSKRHSRFWWEGQQGWYKATYWRKLSMGETDSARLFLSRLGFLCFYRGFALLFFPAPPLFFFSLCLGKNIYFLPFCRIIHTFKSCCSHAASARNTS